jgi:hypothetical protein
MPITTPMPKLQKQQPKKLHKNLHLKDPQTKQNSLLLMNIKLASRIEDSH